VVLAVGAVLAQAQAVNCAGKLSESKVEALLSGGVAQPRVEQIVRSCGIAFEVTPAVASRLRRAGAGNGLIGVLKEIQPKRPEPVVKRDMPAARPDKPVEPKETVAPPPEQPKPTAAPPPEQSKEPAAPPAGSKRVNSKDGLTYVWIPPGTFTMGCSPGDTECFEQEKPAHEVTITKGFWIGQTEVTQAAYERVKGSNPSYFKGASLPVETISWDEAHAYCAAVGMRLPTEAEWEYAARGGNASARYGTLDAVAWHSGNSGSKTHEVAQKQPNGYGLYDTLGNVWEWTADWWDAGYYRSSPRSDPQGPSSGQDEYRALRGGFWDFDPGVVRVSYRVWYGPGVRGLIVGVRCVGETATPPPGQPKTTAAPPPEQPKEPAAPPAGSKRVNPKDGLTYVWIPPGTFTMGCSPGDIECLDWEKPAHQVTITKGFWIGRTEVTQAAYERVKGSNPSHFKGASLPVERISWDDAQAYCAAVGMRLPTEAEWEYAARGGNSSSRYGTLDAVAWYDGNSGSKTHEVAQKQPNGYGLYDTLGNVWEWTADWYDASYYGSSPRSDPQGPSSGQYRALRGGSWVDFPRDARVSGRYWFAPVYRYFVIVGLRCAGDVEKPKETATPPPEQPKITAAPLPEKLKEPVVPLPEEPKRTAEQPKEPAAPTVGSKRVNPKDGLTYVWVPPGTFTMGCSPGDGECLDWEKPAHPVTITKGFWIGQTEVTQAAYERVKGSNPSPFKGASLPVETISWDEAHAYCNAAGMRLPTEAEWEYAARGGNSSARYGTLDAVAWHGGNSGGQTHDVAQKQPNSYGLYDMLGNVWEWTADWFDTSYYGSSPRSDPPGPSSGLSRTLRGGSLVAFPGLARVSYRVWEIPGFRVVNVGVRCVGEVEKPKETAAPPPEQPKITAAPLPEEPKRTAEQPKEPEAPPAGSKRVNPKDGLTYVWVRPGTFTMGCSPGDGECFSLEKPAHPVTITKGFWIGQTEVTQAAYERVTGSNPSYIKGASLPVETISWDDAQAYCRAVGMRLPTEAEWEYAARGGNASARYGTLDAVAWHRGNSGGQTHDVAQKQPNSYGLYDMLGNVWEWTADWFDDYGSSPRSDPQGPSSGQYRALRGSSWDFSPWDARVSNRLRVAPGIRTYFIGVRCVGE